MPFILGRRDFIQFSASKGPQPRHARDPDSASQWLPAVALALTATTHPRDEDEGDAICMNKAGRPICSFHLLCSKLSCQRARIQNSAVILRLHRLLASLLRSFEPKCTFSPAITCFTPNYRSSPNPKWAGGREEAGYRVRQAMGKKLPPASSAARPKAVNGAFKVSRGKSESERNGTIHMSSDGRNFAHRLCVPQPNGGSSGCAVA